MLITDKHKDLMRHTIKGDRNFFGTDKGCTDSILFDDLVRGGLAIRFDAPGWSGDDYVYKLTDDGIYIANK